MAKQHSEIVINATAIGHDLSMGSAMFFKRGQAPTSNNNNVAGNVSSSTDEETARPSTAGPDGDALGEETPVARTHVGEHRATLEDDAFITAPQQVHAENSDKVTDGTAGESNELADSNRPESVFAHAYSVGGAA